MLGNSWHKKEKPFLGLTGLWGGAAGALVGGPSGPTDFSASGGFYSDYGDGAGGNWRSHIFTADGTFSCANIGGTGTHIHYLILGGGGAGGYGKGAGGGAGCVKQGSIAYTSLTKGDWDITIGNGASGGSLAWANSTDHNAAPGTPSSVTFPNGIITAPGGGTGAGSNNDGSAGGSGGGGSWPTKSGGTGDGDPGWSVDGTSPSNGWGHDGGEGFDTDTGGGGGGVSDPGSNSNPTTGGAGGDGGTTNWIMGPSGPFAFGGGGGGGSDAPGGPGTAGAGGGGTGGSPANFPSANMGGDATSYGSGGGAAGYPSSQGGYGSNGIVIIRYKREAARTNTATGGWISNITAAESPTGSDQTVHVFAGDGPYSFVAPTSLSCNFLVVGAGGACSYTNHGGGGGGGGVCYREGVTFPATTYPITIGVGGEIVNSNDGAAGTNTYMGSPTTPLIYQGGGGGLGNNNSPGGGGSGGGRNNNQPTGTSSPTGISGHPGGIDVQSPFPGSNWANGGGASPTSYSTGGGGASEVSPAPPGSAAGRGGNGARYGISGTVMYYGGGGGGGGHTGSPSPQADGGLGGGGMGGIFWNNPSPNGGEGADIGRNGGNGFGGGAGGTGKYGLGGPGGTPYTGAGNPLIPAVQGGRAAGESKAAKGGSGVVIISYPT